MTKQMCIHCYVTGKVQGVWFRASTKEEAEGLGLKGWARNLPDGRVEVLACGDQEALAKLHDWLKQGPSRAEVNELTYEELPWESHEGFKVL